MKDRITLPVLLLVFVILAAGIVAAGCLLYRSQRDSCRTEAEHKLAAVADLKVSELSLWRKERLAFLFVGALLFGGAAAVGFVWRKQHATLYREKHITDRTRVEEDMRASEYRYRTLYESSRDALMLATPEEGFLAGNPATLAMFECKDEREFTSYSPTDLSPEYQRDGALSSVKAQEMMAIALQDGSHFFEWTHKRAGGDEFPATVLLTRMNLEGKLLLQATVRDISKERQAEEGMREFETRFRGLIENSKDGIMFADMASMTIVSGNQAMAAMLGRPLEELPGISLFEIHPADSHDRIAQEFEQQRLGNRQLSSNIPITRKDGSLVYVDITSTTVMLNGVKHMGGFFRDVTERKMAEAERERLLVRQEGVSLLQRSLLAPAPLEDKLRSITDGIVRLFDADFCRIWLTRPGDLCEADCIYAEVQEGPHVCRQRDRCLHLLASSGRYTRVDGQGHRRVPFGCYRVGRVASGEEHKFLTNDVQNDPCVHNHPWARELGLVSFAGYQLRAPDGKTLGVLALFAKHPISADENAMLDGLGSTAELVVQQASAEAELAAARLAADAANRAKSEFLANMSHEIRTPMTSILGFTDLLLQGDSTEDKRREYLQIVQQNGQSLLQLINDILDLSKIEAGKFCIEKTACSPVGSVADVASLMRVRAEPRQLTLLTEFSGPIPATIHTDPTRLRQILINLVGNAIKFTESGTVRIVTHLREETGRPPLMQFDVINTGIGMTEEQIARLFQPFTQADMSTSRRFGGTGLGLTISRRMAEILGGTICVQSVLGKGSTFSVTVDPGPLDSTPMLDNPSEAVVPNSPSRRRQDRELPKLDSRVLLVEDGPDNQRLIAFFLRKAGAHVTLAENGQEAIEKIAAATPSHGNEGRRSEPFDVILMDMQMPVLDGYEATRRLRAMNYTGPIIALTAHAMSQERQHCLDAGCDDYATKPLDRQKLLATVAHWAGRGRAHDDSPDPSTSESKASTTALPTLVYSDLAADPEPAQFPDA